MLDIEKFKKIIKSNNFQEIVKESKEAYNYLLFKDNRIDLYNKIFSTIDYNLILKIPILYILYCKLLKYNNKILKLNDILNDSKNIIISNESEVDKKFFEANILLLEAYKDVSNNKNNIALLKLQKALEKIDESFNIILLSEIYYEIGYINFSFFRISEGLVNFKKSEYYILNEYVTSDNIIFRLKLNIGVSILLKNKLYDCLEEVKKIELFLKKTDLDNSYLIFYYDLLSMLFFYTNKKDNLIEIYDKSLNILENSMKLPAFMCYLRLAIYLLLVNEIEKSKVLINIIEEKFKLVEPPKKIRFFLYALNIIFSYKNNDLNMYKIWVDELGKLFDSKYENDYSIAIFYANCLLENNELKKVEEVNLLISNFIYSTDSDILKLQLDLLNIVIEYKKGYKNKAILNLKEKLFLAQKEWNVGIFLNSNTILLNMINEIYNEALNKKNILDSNFLKEIISYSNENFDFNNYLTEKEIEVLKLVEQKKSNKEIANILFLSVNTIKTHLKNITKKLNVNTKNDAVIKAKEYFII